MNEIAKNQITTSIKSFFNIRDPAGLRCLAVLDGNRPGKIFTDSSRNPTWAIVWESVFGTLYPGGDANPLVVRELIHRFQKESNVYIGLWPQDPFWKFVRKDYDYEGRVLDFYDRIRDGRLQKFLAERSQETSLCQVNNQLIERSINRDLHLSGYPSSEKAMEDLIGYFMMRNNDILSEALAGAEVNGTREIGVDTPERYRRRGYATITCAKLIQTCENQGFQTYWNCNKENKASVALARKLGYRTEKEYKLLVWERKPG